MYYVSIGHTVTLNKVLFKAGKPLPAGRDYSALVTLGMVTKAIPEPVKPYEPSIVKIQRDKRNKAKKEQAKGKKERIAAKKAAKAKAEKEKADKAKPEKKVFTVETGG